MASTTISFILNATSYINSTVTEVSYNGSDSNSTATTAAPSSGGGGPPPPGVYGDIRTMLWKVVPPIIITWGTIGNILTILVLLRQRKTSSTAIYLLTLALSDLTILYLGPLRNWVKRVWEIDIRYMSDAGCRIHLYMTYCSIHFSSWLLVAVTWERTLSVLIPHKVRLCCTTKRAIVVIVGILVFILGFNMVVPITNNLDGLGQSNPDCSPYTVEYKEFHDNVYLWMDFSMAFAIPGVLLIIGNCIIVVQLYRSRAKQRQMSRSHKDTGRDTKSISVLMVCLCSIFLVTMTPIHVYLFVSTAWMKRVLEMYKTDPLAAWESYQYLLFLGTVCNLLGYTNASFNFILYVFSGSKFRSDLATLLCCRKPKTAGAFGSKRTESSGKRTTSTTYDKSSGVYNVGIQKNQDSNKHKVAAAETMEAKTLMTVDNQIYEEELITASDSVDSDGQMAKHFDRLY